MLTYFRKNFVLQCFGLLAQKPTRLTCPCFLQHFSLCSKKRYPERGREKASLQEEKEPKFRQHMFLGRPLLSALDERRDTLAVSCNQGLAPHLSRWSFLAGAAIFILVHGKMGVGILLCCSTAYYQLTSAQISDLWFWCRSSKPKHWRVQRRDICIAIQV